MNSSDLNSLYSNSSAGAGQEVQGIVTLLTATAHAAVTPTLRKNKATKDLSV